MTLTIGIDPGLRGAIAVLSPAGEIERLEDLPICRDRKLGWVDGGALQSFLIDACAGRPARAFVERVSAWPGQGVVSSFTFGSVLGSILSIVQARQLPIELLPPTAWKRALNLPADKKAALDMARLLFPTADLLVNRAELDGRAEALLIAHVGRRRALPAAAREPA